MQGIDKVYLDVFGVLRSMASPQREVEEFLRFCLDNYLGRVYWLTSYCRGGVNHVNLALRGALPDQLVNEAYQKVRPTDWRRAKTEAIDFGVNFVWFDDLLRMEDKQILEQHQAMGKFFRMDPRDPEMARKALEFLRSRTPGVGV